MKIELRKIKIKELVDGYIDNQENGVLGFKGRLNIRPKYQREFVYKDKQRDKVIDSIIKGFPLNTMYWVVTGDEQYEVLDGQQRTISICQYITGSFSFNYKFFHNLTESEKENILNYELYIYFCEGSNTEKLDWFRTINIAGEKLTEQELRNAVYTGTWLSDAKSWFSKTNCQASNIGSTYLSGSPIRQDYLETVLDWISNDSIEEYMANHQHDKDASELWVYFQAVISWIERLFPNYRKEMKNIAWGKLYNDFKDVKLNPNDLEEKIKSLMIDEDVTKKSGIYPYIFTNDERYLSIRAFSQNIIREAYERQGGVCIKCNEKFEIDNMQADHIIPWSKGGKTISSNCQMLCSSCNRTKSDK